MGARTWLARLRPGTGRSGEGTFVRERFYDSSYFEGEGERKPGSSGYGGYTRGNSNADVAAYLLWRFLSFDTGLDLGCAKGFLVEALVELGYDAYGWDISEWAVSGSPAQIRERLAVVDIEAGLPERRAHDRYSLITALEVLEHVEPSGVGEVLRGLRRISSGYVVATIPSLGGNANGPDGFPDGKVATDRLDHYKALGPAYEGPVPMDDLMKDEKGNPIEGHLTVASFEWWTKQFEAAGFSRMHEVEAAMHPVVGRFDLSVAWNLYVFHVDDANPPPSPVRTQEDLAKLERDWNLHSRPLGQHSRNLTAMTVGNEGVRAIESEYEAENTRHGEG